MKRAWLRHMNPRHRLMLVSSVLMALTAALLGVAATGLNGGGSAGKDTIPHDDMQACLTCHASEMEGRHAINMAAFLASPHKDFKCQDCHSAFTSAPHTPAMLKQKASCGDCHSEQRDQYRSSTHSKPDKVPGDHPNCVTCHGNGDPHAIKSGKLWPRAAKVALCSRCHGDVARMSRYGVDPDAVPSYNESFHGKALLRFGNLHVAICTDCHGHHGVLNPNDPRAPTNRANAAKTCAQAGCHHGAKVNFAMSGANHLRLKVKASLILSGELLFFRCLIFGIITGMLIVIALDLRKELSGAPPACGRVVGVLLSLSYLCMAATLALATLQMRAALYSFGGALVLLAVALVAYFARREQQAPAGPAHPQYLRLPWALRAQHFCLFVSFTLLVMTGMPLRFSYLGGDITRIPQLFGGFASARIVHRSAALLLIATAFWHLGWLLLRWSRAGFSLRSWTMLPVRKDMTDLKTAFRYYFGLSPKPPQYSRFQFREKLDYLVEYWGIPVMVLSGLVLWFPIYFGNRLPEIGLSFAYIAHSYEATLAFLAIITWHMYNAHFNPSSFPMKRVWYTGTLSQEEMEREHPLELEPLDEAGNDHAPGTPGQDAAPLTGVAIFAGEKPESAEQTSRPDPERENGHIKKAAPTSGTDTQPPRGVSS
ncbi:MAG TPA: cytochrome b/b6 domain-containing protein [Chthonomonadaceae bacterium]|nr:cytochrome b/b6 domain-containing protein [Chthonomonadaceae bacterium]